MSSAARFDACDRNLHDCDQLSIVLEDGSHISPLCKDGDFPTFFHDDATTTYEAVLKGLQISNNGPFLGKRNVTDGPYEWMSYSQVLDASYHFGCGLLSIGVIAGQKTFLGIYCETRIEWVVSALAASMFSMVTVPIYETHGKDACRFIISQTELGIIMCDSNERLAILLADAQEFPHLNKIVIIDTPNSELVKEAELKNIKLLTYQQLMKYGESDPKERQPAKSSDLLTICYTSGTTGIAKGVMITHKSLIVGSSSFLHLIQSAGLPTKFSEVVVLSYLPLAHMYEHISQASTILCGGRIGFYSGDVKRLMSDLQELKPNYFCAIPRVINRVYDKVHAESKKSKFNRALFNMAMKFKQNEMKKGKLSNNGFIDKLVFKKISQMFGGRLKFMFVTSAPVSPEVVSFLRCVLGCPVSEGFGMTEASVGITISHPYDLSSGHAGAPFPGTKVKLVDVTELDYFTSNNIGEVCAKSINLCNGYFKEPEKTAELIDKDGWLHTGDIGTWLPNGGLKLISRKSDVIKLSQGKAVAVTKTENIYVRSPIVLQIYVHGDSSRNFLVGIVVTDPDVLSDWASSQGLPSDMENFCRDEKANTAVLQELTELGKKAGLMSIEQVRAIHLHREPFTVENGLVTPTFKNKRHVMPIYFQKEIENMYSCEDK